MLVGVKKGPFWEGTLQNKTHHSTAVLSDGYFHLKALGGGSIWLLDKIATTNRLGTTQADVHQTAGTVGAHPNGSLASCLCV